MNTPKHCTDYQELFTEYLDHDLEGATLSHFNGHLENCAHCSQELLLFQKTIASINRLEFVPAPPHILAGIHEKLHKPNTLRAFLDSLRHIDFSMSIPTATATVAIALTAAFLFKSFPQNQSVQPIAPTQETARVQKTAPLSKPGTTAQFASTGQRLAPYFKYPNENMNGLNGQASSLQDLMNTYMDLHTRPVDPLFKDPVTQNQLRPDMLITVETPTPRSQLALYKSLMKEGRWQAHLHENNLLLLFMNPRALPELRRTLAKHNVVLYPPEAAIAYLGSRKNMLTVAIRLQ